MRAIVYGAKPETRKVVESLRRCGHKVLCCTDKLFKASETESCDAAVVVLSNKEAEITHAYLGRGIDVFTVSNTPAVIPGYP